MSTFFSDLKFGCRMLAKRPGVTVIAVLILALGIGANTALFTIIQQILMSPLDFPESERLMMVEPKWKDGGLNGSSSGPDFLDWRERNTVFEELSAFTMGKLNLTKAGDARTIRSFHVTPNFFSTFHDPLSLGRDFQEHEVDAGHRNVAILSYRLWQERYAGDPNIVNQTIDVDKEPHTVIGVAAQAMGFIEDYAQIYVPLPREVLQRNRGSHHMVVLGRLKENTSIAQAQANMTQIANQLQKEYPKTNSSKDIHVGSLHERFISDIRPAFYMLYGAVSLLLLVACVNISNLLIANASVRRREMVIRQALGCGRWRLMRQLLTECLLLGFLGGALGLLFAFTGLDLIQLIAPKIQATGGKIPGFEEMGLNGTILGFTLLLSLLTSFMFGLIPAWQGARVQLNQTLKETGTGLSRGPRRHRTLGSLVIIQIALAFVLLIGAGLLVKSFNQLQKRNPGFNPEGLLAIHIDRPRSEKAVQDMKPDAFFDLATQKLADLPGVEAAGAISLRPLDSDNNNLDVRVIGHNQNIHSEFRRITCDYFRCMAIPLKQGRFFKAQDRRGSEKVIIVNQAFVDRLTIKGDPLGQKINPGWGPHTIIGIVGNVTLNSLSKKGYKPIVYIPHTQSTQHSMTIFIRTEGDPVNWSKAIRQTIRDIDANQPILYMTRMSELAMESVSIERFCTILIGFMAVVALFMALIGLYAVMTFAVNERRVEIGIRMAMGAEKQSILLLMIKKALHLTLIGLGIGLIAALAFCKSLNNLLYEVNSWDPATFIVVPALLFCVAMLACYIPARKATQLDPMKVLRYE